MAASLTHDTAVALLANTLATGAMLVVLISTLGPISGAHFNPAVSLVLALRRQLSARDLGLYVLVQLAGGIAGTLLAHAMFGLPLLEASTKSPHRGRPVAIGRHCYVRSGCGGPGRAAVRA